MSKKEYIDHLHKINSNYQHQEQAENLANSLDIVSDDIYSESQRFIYELIQNADDAAIGDSVEIYIEVTQNFIIVSHTGKEFTEHDVQAISKIGSSQKKNNPKQTGYKGIGFKSVFSKSNCVYIRSNGFQFRFDKLYWEGKRSHKMPWQIIPIWYDEHELPQDLRNSHSFKNSHKFPVSTAIKCKNPQEIKNSLEELFTNSQIMLFLRNARKITINDPPSKNFSIEKNKLYLPGNKTFAKVTLKERSEHGETICEWLVRDFVGIPIPPEIQENIAKDDKTPPKLKDAKYTTLSLATKVEGHKLVPLKTEEAIIFTYLPTKVKFGFPFLVNGEFLTKAEREGFHEDRIWNIWLFREIAIKIFEWLSELAMEQQYKFQITNLIPEKFPSYSSDLLKQAFNQGFDWSIQNIAFIPSELSNIVLKANEALIENTGIKDVVGRLLLIEYYNEKFHTDFDETSLVHNQLLRSNKLTELGVKVFKLKHITDFLVSENFQKTFRLGNNFILIKFLYEKYQNNVENSDFRKNLQVIPFIFDETEVLAAPNTPIYLPLNSIEINIENSEELLQFKFIHPEVLARVKENQEIYDWLCQDVGITEPTEKNIIEKTLIPNIGALTNTTEKSLNITRYLFNAYKKGMINDESLKKLNQIQLISKSDKLRLPNQCYLSDCYKPELSLEKHLKPNVFLTEKYTNQIDDIKEWNRFFTKIGVYEKIQIINAGNNTYQELYEKSPKYTQFVYDQFIASTKFAPYTHQHEFENLITVVFLPQTSNYNFSKIFWKYVIPQWELFFQEKTLYWVGYFYRESFNVTTYFEYFITYQPCIPTTLKKCYQAKEVLINREDFKTIGEGFLPILDLDIEISKEIREFFGFKTQLSLTDYLNVLHSLPEIREKENNIQTLQKRVGLIYQELLKFREPDEQKTIQEWSLNNKILAKDNSFYLPTDLSYVDLLNFEPPSNIDKFVYIPSELSNKEGLVNLLQLMGVNIISIENRTLTPKNIQKTSELQNQLKERCPLIALLLSNRNYSEWLTEFTRLSTIIENTEFYQAQEINLEFVQNGHSLIKQKCNSCLNENQFYYVGQWDKAKTRYQLMVELCNLLEMQNLERELELLLRESFEDALEWLKDRGYDIKLIPEEYQSKPHEKVSYTKTEEELSSKDNSSRSQTSNPNPSGKGDVEYREKLSPLVRKLYESLNYVVQDFNGFEAEWVCRKKDETDQKLVEPKIISNVAIRIPTEKWLNMMELNNYEIAILSHSGGKAEKIYRIINAKKVLIDALSDLSTPKPQLVSDAVYPNVESLIGLQKDRSSHVVILRWDRLIEKVKHSVDLVEVYEINNSEGEVEFKRIE